MATGGSYQAPEWRSQNKEVRSRGSAESRADRLVALLDLGVQVVGAERLVDVAEQSVVLLREQLRYLLWSWQTALTIAKPAYEVCLALEGDLLSGHAIAVGCPHPRVGRVVGGMAQLVGQHVGQQPG